MTTRAVLIGKKDRYGKQPVKICVTIKGKRTYCSTGKRIKESDWNGKEVKKTAPDAASLNAFIRKKIAEVDRALTDMQLRGEPVTVHNVSRKLRNKNVNDSFFPYANALVKDLVKKKFSPGTIKNYNKYLKKIKENCSNFHFSDVDHKWLRKFEGFLHQDGYANNTIHSCFKIFKKIFNSARKDGVTENYPFVNYDSPRYRQTLRTFLTYEELIKIEELLNKPLPNYIENTIKYFLLGAFSSLRFGDWRKFNYEGFVQGDRLVVRTTKTGEIVSVKMHQKLREAVERLKDAPPIYSEPKTNYYLKAVAKLAGINKNITTHVSRHSYCTHCLRLNISESIIARTMGINTKTLQTYKHLMDSTVDEELQKWNEKTADAPTGGKLNTTMDSESLTGDGVKV